MSDAPLAAVTDRPAVAGPATGAVDLWRIPGEAMPGWAIGLAGLVGAALAVVAIDPWLTTESVAVTEPTVALAPPSRPAVAPSAPAVVPPAAPVAVAPAAVVSGEAPRGEAPVAEAVAAPAAPAPVPAPAPVAEAAVASVAAAVAPAAEVSTPPAAVAAASGAPSVPPVPGPTATAQASVPAAVPAASVAAAAPPCLPVVGIAFARGSSRLESGPWEAASEPLRRWVAEHPGTTLSVEGHADTSGTEDFNLVLSFARARAAVAGLGRLGVAEDRMIARAAGTDQPRNGPAGITTNRLVVLRVDGVDVCRDVERTRQP